MPTFPTVLTVLNQVAAEVGVETTTDPFSDYDASMTKLLALLIASGQELASEPEGGWSHLRATHDFTVDGTIIDTSGIYALPSRFLHPVDGTAWDRRTHWPVHTLTGQQQAALDAGALGSQPFTPMLRVVADRLHVYPRPVPVNTRITFEYVTENWIAVTGGSGPSMFSPVATTDEVWFPQYLITRLLALKFRQAVGLDTVAAQVDYERALGRALGRDRTASPLSICGPNSGVKYLDDSNIPDTGFGT